MIITGLGFRTCIIRQIRILQRALWEKHMNIEGIKMENSYKYFKNKDCKYFPCHKGLSDEFNCLFCYCPMYSMPNCPGSKTYIEKNGKKIKVCTDCTFPHRPENYDKIIQILIRNNNNWISALSEVEFNEELEKGYADMQAGRTKNAKKAFSDIRKDYGLWYMK